MAPRRRIIPGEVPRRERDLRDIELEDLRRQVQQLQQQLQRHRAEPLERDVSHHGSENDSEMDENPFHADDGGVYSDDSNNPPRRRHPGREGRDDVKIDILEFDGKARGDDFVEWLLTVERIFDFKEYSDEKKVKLVAIKLRGYASYWWENLKRQREREGRNQILIWEKMKRELKGRFLTDTYKQENYLRLYNFRQGELPVEEYTKEFEFLKLKCDVRELEEQTIARYLGGLQKNIAYAVRLQPYWFFNNVQKLAINVEKQQQESMKSTFKKMNFLKVMQIRLAISQVSLLTKMVHLRISRRANNKLSLLIRRENVSSAKGMVIFKPIVLIKES